ncbi:MAG: hypothetical protein HY903_10430 [Deltaproteobacteria bacterium]|nr:hypothetical protein [Deltaproteobacteria bacterium]
MRSFIIANGLVLFLAAGVGAEEAAADPMAELAALANDAAGAGPEGGGSIRAKKDPDMSQSKRLKDPKNLEAKIDAVLVRDFPLVALTVVVLQPAKDGAGKDVKKNDKLVIAPRLKVDGKTVALADPDTVVNAGAYYLRKGDKVAIRLGANKGKYWEAEYVERK